MDRRKYTSKIIGKSRYNIAQFTQDDKQNYLSTSMPKTEFTNFFIAL